MSDASRNAVSCAELQRVLRESPRQTHTLTGDESSHVEGCDACLEAWLETMVTQALDAKPEVQIPEDFAKRVAAQVPAKQEPARVTEGDSRRNGRHWGLLTASVLVAGGLIATAFADPTGWSTRVGVIVTLIVASEIAGIALWLGTGRSGEHHG